MTDNTPAPEPSVVEDGQAGAPTPINDDTPCRSLDELDGLYDDLRGEFDQDAVSPATKFLASRLYCTAYDLLRGAQATRPQDVVPSESDGTREPDTCPECGSLTKAVRWGAGTTGDTCANVWHGEART